jgi:AbrB family looped-hinge helix DNA binding protein
MNASVVTTKGQVVIPAKLRRRFRIKPGTRVHFFEKDGELRLVPLTTAFIESNIGFLRTGGRLTRALLREKKRDRGI